jgi:hypothetical protein
MVELYSEPGCYTLMEVMMMTDHFGTMYHGKLQTGQEVAVKVWAEEFHEFGTSAAEEFHQFERVRSPIS